MPRRALVKTAFVDWSSKYFAQSIKNKPYVDDFESDSHYTREWKYIRNAQNRKRALEELHIPGIFNID